jgi:hypothetical protein
VPESQAGARLSCASCGQRLPAPGLGIDLDEKLAARFPAAEPPFDLRWGNVRRRDGTVVKP